MQRHIFVLMSIIGLVLVGILLFKENPAKLLIGGILVEFFLYLIYVTFEEQAVLIVEGHQITIQLQNCDGIYVHRGDEHAHFRMGDGAVPWEDVEIPQKKQTQPFPVKATLSVKGLPPFPITVSRWVAQPDGDNLGITKGFYYHGTFKHFG